MNMRDVLTRMIKAGMDVARLNFSHGSHEEHQGKIDLIKKVRQKLHMPIAIMLDTKGPEYRIKTFENGKIELKDGDTFTLTTDDIVGNQERVSVNYENLIKDLKVGDRVLCCERNHHSAGQRALKETMQSVMLSQAVHFQTERA